MARDPKFDEARKLIEAFAERLLALNEGKKIPAHWRIYLTKALKPEPGKAGRKHNYEEVKKIVKEIFLDGDWIFQPRTKLHNPATYKRNIAAKLGVKNLRQVTRRVNDVKQLNSLIAEWKRKGLNLEPAKRNLIRAILGAIGEASTHLSEETVNRKLTAAGLQFDSKSSMEIHQKEIARRQEQARRRNRKSPHAR